VVHVYVHTVIIEGVKGIQQTLNWLIQCEVTKVMEYNNQDWPHFVATGKSTYAGSLSLSVSACVVRDCNSTSATPRVVQDEREVEWVAEGGQGGQGICQVWDTHQCEIFSHWSPDEPMTEFSRPKEGRARGNGPLFLTLPRTLPEKRKVVLTL
jgi:hypothetical protein